MNNNPLITFSTTPDGEWSYRITPEGNRSHLLQFLVRSCPEQLPPARQLLSKLCAIGYLLKPEKDHNFSPPSSVYPPTPKPGNPFSETSSPPSSPPPVSVARKPATSTSPPHGSA